MRRWICVVWAVLLGLLAGCGRPQQAATVRAVPFQTEGDNVKVMTFNIRYGTANDGPNQWDNRRHMVLDTIIRQGADVVGLQEALDFQVDQISGELSGYKVISTGRNDGKRAGEHCTILYRSDRFKAVDSGTFWFSNSPWVPGSKHWGNTIPRICTWARLIEQRTGRSMVVYNLHMDHQSQVSRFKSAQQLSRFVAQRQPKDPVIVMGDFNMGLDNPGMMYLRRLGYPGGPIELLDSWRLLNPDKPDTATAHSFKGGTDGAKIDHILVERATEVLDAAIDRTCDADGRYPSDHYPVTATLRLWP